MAKNDFDELMSVGVDIGKDVFHLVGFDKEGRLVLRKKIIKQDKRRDKRRIRIERNVAD